MRAPRFRGPRRSKRYLEWRFAEYPLFREFTGLWGEHDGEVVLDYGCGPGNDLTGLALDTGARRLIGVDVSREGALARGPGGSRFTGSSRTAFSSSTCADADPGLPLEDGRSTTSRAWG